MTTRSIIAAIKKCLWALRFLTNAMLVAKNRALLLQILVQHHQWGRAYDRTSLPQFLSHITPASPDLIQHWREAELLPFIDNAARILVWSPFGLCLRRSLLRYHFMGRVGLTLGIVFAVRWKQDSEGSGLGGHAWNTYEGNPFHERDQDYLGFTEVYHWP